jgi:hypothetical protein
MKKGSEAMGDMTSLTGFIANVGFPIAVAAYLLIRIESKLAGLTQAIAELRECICAFPVRGYGYAEPNRIKNAE